MASMSFLIPMLQFCHLILQIQCLTLCRHFLCPLLYPHPALTNQKPIPCAVSFITVDNSSIFPDTQIDNHETIFHSSLSNIQVPIKFCLLCLYNFLNLPLSFSSVSLILLTSCLTSASFFFVHFLVLSFPNINYPIFMSSLL